MVPVTPEGTGGVLGTETAAHVTALVFNRDHPDRMADRSPAPYHTSLFVVGLWVLHTVERQFKRKIGSSLDFFC